MTTTSRRRKLTYYLIINTQLWKRQLARALQTIQSINESINRRLIRHDITQAINIYTVEFLQKLSRIDDVAKYRSIAVSRYF